MVGVDESGRKSGGMVSVEDRVRSKIRQVEEQIEIEETALTMYQEQGGQVDEVGFYLGRRIKALEIEKREWEWVLNG